MTGKTSLKQRNRRAHNPSYSNPSAELPFGKNTHGVLASGTDPRSRFGKLVVDYSGPFGRPMPLGLLRYTAWCLMKREQCSISEEHVGDMLADILRDPNSGLRLVKLPRGQR